MTSEMNVHTLGGDSDLEYRRLLGGGGSGQVHEVLSLAIFAKSRFSTNPVE